MSLAVTLTIIAVVAVASTVQGIIGFGFALFVAPVTAAVIDPRAAVVVVTLLGTIIPSGMAWTYRSRIAVQPATRLSVGVVLGVAFVVLTMASSVHLRRFRALALAAP